MISENIVKCVINCLKKTNRNEFGKKSKERTIIKSKEPYKNILASNSFKEILVSRKILHSV